MAESLLVAVALLGTPLGAVIAPLIGRGSVDAAARIAATLTGISWTAGAALAALLFAATETSPVAILTVDALAVVMLLLVLGLSFVIQIFATRYLRNDARQVWFVTTANLLTGSTALMVCAGTVLTFAVAWLAAGMSLVALLATYRALPQARDGVRRAARNFAIGDAALVGALGAILWIAGGDIPLTEVAESLAGSPTWLLATLAVLLVIPALARSSQVPFHRWLPSTLAAPTPVSALMHAGVVNAGAILILRFSPLISESSLAMGLIFAAGAVTVVGASVVRLVKPDVKGRLVFSTMAQMGFMFLACGLGAYAAAVFHLVGHGLFKSARFLGAGSGVSAEATYRDWPERQKPPWQAAVAAIAVGAGIPIGAILLVRAVLALELSAASQALQLFVVLTAGIALATALRIRFSGGVLVVGTLAITALAFGYSALVAGFDRVLAIAPATEAVGAIWLALPALGLLAVQLLTIGGSRGATRWLFAVALAAGSPTTSEPRLAQGVRRGTPA